MIYANEIDKHAAHWLSCLPIQIDHVDSRSIADVKGADLDGYKQCHFFAGIAGWPLALEMAGWPDDAPVWTGSCPCQPFSAAGKRRGTDDERHLWPEFKRLIQEVQPPVIFGEQVASSEVVGTQLEAAFIAAVQSGDYAAANKHANRLVKTKTLGGERRWIDAIQAELEPEGYALRFDVLGAHSVGAPHIRQRLFWVAYANDRNQSGIGRSGSQGNAAEDERRRRGVEADGGSSSGKRLGDPQGDGREQRRAESDRRNTTAASGGVAHAESNRGRAIAGPVRSGEASRVRSQEGQNERGSSEQAGRVVNCGSVGVGLGNAESIGHGQESERRSDSEGQAIGRERIARGSIAGDWYDVEYIPCRDGKARPVKPGLRCLAHGIPGRVAQLRGLGNAIVPALAAQFVRAFMDSIGME